MNISSPGKMSFLATRANLLQLKGNAILAFGAQLWFMQLCMEYKPDPSLLMKIPTSKQRNENFN